MSRDRVLPCRPGIGPTSNIRPTHFRRSTAPAVLVACTKRIPGAVYHLQVGHRWFGKISAGIADDRGPWLFETLAAFNNLFVV